MSRARQHHSVSRRQASQSAKRAFGSPARGSARRQAQTEGASRALNSGQYLELSFFETLITQFYLRLSKVSRGSLRKQTLA